VPLVMAAVALDDGDASAALAYAEKYMRGIGGDQPIESAAALELLVPIRIRLGELAPAREAHAQLAAIAEAVATDLVRAGERCAAGWIALADQDLDPARRAFEDAIDLYERSVAPWDAAYARVALARVLAAQERGDAALDEALAARATFEELGAKRAAKVANKLAGRLSGWSGGAQRAGLTRRELEVLTLVAEGLSNPQIAERLIVSEHTVHRHVANIYAKLQVSSRAAAVAVAAERELLA